MDVCIEINLAVIQKGSISSSHHRVHFEHFSLQLAVSVSKSIFPGEKCFKMRLSVKEGVKSCISGLTLSSSWQEVWPGYS